MTIAETLTTATHLLAPVTDTPRLDAEILLAHAFGISRASLLARLRDSIDHSAPERPGRTARTGASAPPAPSPGGEGRGEGERSSANSVSPPAAQFDSLLQRRLNHEPIAYILGHWEFFSLDFITRPPMLVPRPETEHLVEAGLEHLGKDPARVLDLCTGTGCVAIAIGANAVNANVTATDINPAAVQLARENSARHQVALQLFEGDLFDALPPGTAPFDVITANPPYVADAEWDSLPAVIRLHEDPCALLAGSDGLSVLRKIAAKAGNWLKSGGLLALEIGEDQYDQAAEILERSGYHDIRFRRDLAGIKRIIQARRE